MIQVATCGVKKKTERIEEFIFSSSRDVCS
jgi:hypothetical protein